MTNEEAIAVLQKIKPTPRRADGKSTNHLLETIALDMAIKALNQESKPMVEIDLYSVIKQKYIERDVLDKIMDEVFDIDDEIVLNPDSLYERKAYVRLGDVMDIIEKYTKERDGEK